VIFDALFFNDLSQFLVHQTIINLLILFILAADLKSLAGYSVPVRLRPSAPL